VDTKTLLRLRVREARQPDVGKGTVRLAAPALRALDLKRGDVVRTPPPPLPPEKGPGPLRPTPAKPGPHTPEPVNPSPESPPPADPKPKPTPPEPVKPELYLGV